MKHFELFAELFCALGRSDPTRVDLQRLEGLLTHPPAVEGSPPELLANARIRAVLGGPASVAETIATILDRPIEEGDALVPEWFNLLRWRVTCLESAVIRLTQLVVALSATAPAPSDFVIHTTSRSTPK